MSSANIVSAIIFDKKNFRKFNFSVLSDNTFPAFLSLFLYCCIRHYDSFTNFPFARLIITEMYNPRYVNSLMYIYITQLISLVDLRFKYLRFPRLFSSTLLFRKSKISFSDSVMTVVPSSVYCMLHTCSLSILFHIIMKYPLSGFLIIYSIAVIKKTWETRI